MLNDRDYMRMREAPFRSGPVRRRGGPSMVLIIILLNAAVFMIQTPGLQYRFALITPAVMHGQIYRMVTSMFLHGGFSHILFNMWGVYLFGRMVEERLGSSRFLMLYFISGILGSVIWILTNPSPVLCIGASGAVFGLAIGAAMLCPDVMVMLIIPPIPMKLKTFAVVYVLLEIFFELSKVDEGTPFGGIAHIVHLGGALGGYLYLKIACSREIRWDILPRFGGGRPRPAAPRMPGGWDILDNERVSQRELDRLLDKISETGINSLTPEEEDTLRRAREQMKRH